MKIAIDARFYGLENGGLGRYTINLIEELGRIDTKNEYIVLLREKWFEKLNLPKNFTKIKVTSRHYSLKEQIEIPWVLYKTNADLTHFLHFNVPILFRKKYVLTIHDLLMHFGVGREATTLPWWKFKIKRMAYRLTFDNAVRGATKIIVPSNFVASELTKVYKDINKDKVVVLYEGVSEFTGKKKDNNHGKYFLYAGNAYPHKNVLTLLKALSIFNKQNGNKYKLVLVTPRDAFSSKLMEQIEAEGVSRQVEVKSGVSDEELYGLYSNSIAFVYPSFSEGFGLQGLEAMKSKTRLLASNISIFKEIYEKNAIYFDPYDKGSLVSALKEVASEKPTVRASKIKSATTFVERYSWKKMTRDTLAMYESA